MNTSSPWHIFLRSLIAAAFLLPLFGPAAGLAGSSTSSGKLAAITGISSDDFNLCTLDTNTWTFVNPTGDGVVDVDGTRVFISTPGGAAHEIRANGNFTPRIMQLAPNSNFEVEIKFDSPVTQTNQMLGIVVEQDSRNVIYFEFSNRSAIQFLQASKIINGKQTVLYSQALTGTHQHLYLKVNRKGSQWTQQVSSDGQTWQAAGSFSQKFVVSQVGIYSGNSGANPPAHTAVVDYFFNTASPISPEDGNPHEYIVTTAVSGSGSVSRDPDQPTYTCLDAVTLTAEAAPGWSFSGWTGDITSSANPISATLESNLSLTANFADTSEPEPLEIGAIQVAQGENWATISWTTSELAEGTVAYGITPAYESGVAVSSSPTTTHAVTLTALTPSTEYHYQIFAANVSGTSSATSEGTFITSSASSSNSGIESDDFNVCSLDGARWTFINPLGDGTVMVNGSQAMLFVPGGSSHDVWTGGIYAPRIMQAAENTDFEVEVKFESSVSQTHQIQGLIIEQDAQTYLRFDIYFEGSTPRVFAARIANGSPTILFSQEVAAFQPPVYLRVNRQGSQWSQYYSFDGQTWLTGASFSDSLAVTSAGVFAGNAGSNPPAHTAVIDYFFNTAAPIQPEDAIEYSNTLATGTAGNGAVQRSPDKNTYSCNEEVQLTAVAEPGWRFAGWSGDISATENPTTISMTGDRSVTAHFEEYFDTDAPVISGIQVSANDQRATISWLTNEPAASQVAYGTTSAYELGQENNNALATSHTAALTGLSPNTLYHYQIRVSDASGNTAFTQNATFSTQGQDTIIDLWYGAEQTFGSLGSPQAWVNILGNVSDSDGIAHLSYSLNGGAASPLSVGPNSTRLANSGDFNIDIHRTSLLPGVNQVVITATDTLNNQYSRHMTVNYQAGSTWPLPYNIDWGTTTSIQDAAQVVDGSWTIGPQGVRTLETGYDRLIAIGDIGWTDYEVLVPVTIHSVDYAGTVGKASGPPGVGLLMAWTGHTDNPEPNQQPKAGFIPFGNIGWWRWSSATTAQLEFYGSGYWTNHTPVLGLTYNFKMKVETRDYGDRVYSLKVWENGVTEPPQWTLVHNAGANNLDHGSFLLVAHYADVSFGSVSVTPLGSAMYSVVLSAVGSGNVLVDPLQAAYTPGQTITVTAVPNDGWTFSGWSGDLSGSANPSTLTVNASKHITAHFTSPDPGAEAGLVSDDFNVCSLNTSLWSFINPLGDGSVVVNGSQALISVPGGLSHDVWLGGNYAPRLMQPVENGDFEIAVKFESGVTQQYQMQGVIVEQDSHNYLRFDFHSDGAGLRMLAAHFINGSPTIINNLALPTGAETMYMRILRQGSSWLLRYSLDGQNWTAAASFSHVISTTRVGVFAANAGGNPPAHTAIVDYFFNTAAPIQPEDAQQYQYPLTTHVEGSGSISRSPEKNSYSCNEVVQLTALAEPGWAFSEWAGNVASTDNPILVTMDAAKVITAVFVEAPPLPPAAASDEFNALGIDFQLWSFINPVGDGSVSANGNQALLSVPGGVSHDIWGEGNFSARLMQPTENWDLDVEVKFDSAVSQQYHMQGVIVEQDAHNYLRFDFYSDGTSPWVFAAKFENGAPTIVANQALPQASAPLYMRIMRLGSSWTLLYSDDGNTWQTSTSFNHTMTVTSIGPFAANAGSNPPAHTAVIDYFRVRAPSHAGGENRDSSRADRIFFLLLSTLPHRRYGAVWDLNRSLKFG